MKKQGESLLNIYQTFIRPEFGEWDVIVEDGRPKKFDPLTLVASLTESEVPLPHALGIFDLFWEKATATYPQGKVTPRDIHSLIIHSILDYQPPAEYKINLVDKTLWLANYESIYAPESLELVDKPGFISARKAGKLRAFVTEYLLKKFGIEAANARDAQAQLSKLIQTEDVESLVDRFVKLIRICGFHEVEAGFLNEFCRHLALYSHKAMMPRALRPLNEVQEDLKEAENRIDSARVWWRKPGHGAEQFLQLGVQLAAAGLLDLKGIPALKTPIDAVKQLADIEERSRSLKNNPDLTQTEQRIINVMDELDNKLKACSLGVSVLGDTCRDLVRLLERPSDDELPKTIDSAERFLRFVRISIGGDERVSRLVGTIETRASRPLDFLYAIQNLLAGSGIHGFTHALSDGTLTLVIDPGTEDSSLLDFARFVCIGLFFDAVSRQWEIADLSAFIEGVRSRQATAGLIVSDNELSQRAYDELRAVASKEDVYIIRWDTSWLVRILTSGDSLFDEISESIRRAYRFRFKAAGKENLPKRAAPVSNEVLGYEREQLVTAWQALDTSLVGECCFKLQRLWDTMLWTIADFLIAYAHHKFGEKWAKAATGTSLSGLSCLPTDAGQVEILKLLEEANGLISKHSAFMSLASFIPSAKEIGRLDSIRRFRNQVQHFGPEVTPAIAHQFLGRLDEAARLLSTSQRGFNIVATTELPDGRVLLVYEDGKAEIHDPNVLSGAWSGKSRNLIAFALNVDAEELQLFPTWSSCTKCHSTRPLQFLDSSPELSCSACGARFDLPERFAFLRNLFLAELRRLLRETKKLRRNVIHELEELRRRAWASSQSTTAFASMNHNQLVDRLERVLWIRLSATNAKIHSLRERGVDIIVADPEGAKIGLQVKSYKEISESSFIRNVLAQITDAKSHGLKGFFLVLCGDAARQKEKIGQLLSSLSTIKDEFIMMQRIFTPTQAYWLLFGTPGAVEPSNVNFKPTDDADTHNSGKHA